MKVPRPEGYKEPDLNELLRRPLGTLWFNGFKWVPAKYKGEAIPFRYKHEYAIPCLESMRHNLDVLYDKFNDLANAKNWVEINELVRTTNPETSDPCIVLAMLTLTFRCREHLPARADLFSSFYQVLLDGDEDVYGILTGLKG